MLGLFKKEKNVKVLDTSVLIDGRILKILITGFLDGSLQVPDFVVNELHTLTHSNSVEKRKKGTRGIEILEELQKIAPIKISRNHSDDVNKTIDVDGKLVVLCDELGAKLLTLDYGLNKIAKTKGVNVLNINDLFQAMRPDVVYGDVVVIDIVAKGDRDGQGAGTLEDGSTVFVDDAEDLVGKKIRARVRTVLYNPSGRLIFARKIESL